MQPNTRDSKFRVYIPVKFCPIQNFSVYTMKLNTLISDEIVLKDHAYRLEQYGEDFFLSENGEYA